MEEARGDGVWCGREEAEARRGGSSSQGTGITGSRRWWEVVGGGVCVGLVCGGGASVHRSAVERERDGGGRYFFG
jgi:hypothetical protein